MTGAFRCWSPDDGDLPERCNITAPDAEAAAEKFVEQHDADLDYPAEILVRVDDAIGHRFEFVVDRVNTVSYHARTPAPALALEELHSDELAEGAS
jgi:hypothetical protein